MVKCIRDTIGVFKVGKSYETFFECETHCVLKEEYIKGRTRHILLHTENWDFEIIQQNN